MIFPSLNQSCVFRYYNANGSQTLNIEISKLLSRSRGLLHTETICRVTIVVIFPSRPVFTHNFQWYSIESCEWYLRIYHWIGNLLTFLYRVEITICKHIFPSCQCNGILARWIPVNTISIFVDIPHILDESLPIRHVDFQFHIHFK